jgi:uncharacterized membrane protein YoaK (UPF0700 family)
MAGPASDPKSNPKTEPKTEKKQDLQLLPALALLTFATGFIDAASVLGLGHVFTANMTGNVVLLGFALAHTGSAAAVDCALALAAFLVGAALGGRLASKGVSFTAALAVEVGILALASAVSWVVGGAPHVALCEVALLACAMGLHNASVRKLAVPDMTTTVLTLTLTGLAADSSLAGGQNPRWRRRFLSVALMLLGALTGALLLRCGLKWTITAATAVVAGAGAMSVRGRRRDG